MTEGGAVKPRRTQRNVVERETAKLDPRLANELLVIGLRLN
jgi:hypothetical protein